MPFKYLVDLSLFSGSSDTLRTAIGGFYEPERNIAAPSTPSDYYYDVPEGSSYDVDTIGGAEGINASDFVAFGARSDRISYVLSRTQDTLGDTGPEDGSNPARMTVSKDSMMINTRFPVRLIGNPEHVFSDQHWEKVLLGGMWGREQVPGIIKENFVFDDQHMEVLYPIDAKKIKRLNDLEYTYSDAYGTNLYSTRGDFIEIKPEVNHYIPFYQDYTNNLGSELLIPNAYLMTSIELFGDSAGFSTVPYRYSDYSQNFWNLNFINAVSREKEISEVDYFEVNSGELYYDYTAGTPGYESPYEVLLNDMGSSDGGATASEYTLNYLSKKYSGLVTKYFPISIPNIPLSSSTETVVQNAMQNIIFDQYAGLGYDDDEEDFTDSVIPTVSSDTKRYFPYYVNIKFYSERASRFSNNINFHSYSSKFLKILKEIFLNEIELKPKMIAYECSYNIAEPSYENANVSKEYIRETRQLRYVDFLELLLHSYNNYISETSNCFFVGNPISNPSSLGDLDGFATFQR